MAHTLSDKVIRWCKGPSVTQLLEEDPSKSPGQAIKELFGHESIFEGDSNTSPSEASKISTDASILEAPKQNHDYLEQARKCGNWGDCQPSELFLKLYHASLLTLEHDPLAGVVSPSLMGSTGVIPLTVIGLIEDICRHLSNMIVRAEDEVSTNTLTKNLHIDHVRCASQQIIGQRLQELQPSSQTQFVNLIDGQRSAGGR